MADEHWVRNDGELTELWRSLMGPGGFGTASLWTIFICEDGLVERLIVPIDDIPSPPDGTVEAVVRIFSELLDDHGGTVAFLLSRPGPGGFTDGDLQWARRLRANGDHRLTRWPVHLATQGQIRVFAPDDLMRSA